MSNGHLINWHNLDGSSPKTASDPVQFSQFTPHHSMNYPITNCRQIEEDRSLDLQEYIEQHWEEIQEFWNHEDFPIDDNGYCIQK